LSFPNALAGNDDRGPQFPIRTVQIRQAQIIGFGDPQLYGLVANAMDGVKTTGVELAIPTDSSKILPGYHLFIGFCLASLFLSKKLERGDQDGAGRGTKLTVRSWVPIAVNTTRLFPIAPNFPIAPKRTEMHASKRRDNPGLSDEARCPSTARRSLVRAYPRTRNQKR
jgi:hypothetical protein